MKDPVWRHALLGLMAISSPLFAGPDPIKTIDATAAPARDCLLFVGAKLKVKDEQGWHEIVGVEPGAFVTMADGEPARLPMDRPGFEFSLERVPRITMQEVQLEGLELTAAFTPSRDPRRRWLDNQNLAMSNASDDLNAATRHLRGQIAAQEQVRTMISSAGDRTPPEVIEQFTAGNAPNVDGAMQGLEAAAFAQGNDQFNPALYDRMAHEGSTGCDALRVEGSLSASTALSRPYVVVFVEFTAPGETEPRHRVFAEPLPAMAAGVERPVSFLKGGFPPGYELGKVQLYYFENGREIASPDSERRTTLTRSDAQQFAVLEHVANQRKRGEAAPADVLAELVRPADRTAWTREGRTCFVKVAPSGAVVDVFADAAGRTLLGDPVTESLVHRLAFRPAISAEGQPIETLLKLAKDNFAAPPSS